MTDQLMIETWLGLMRPHFPKQAEVSFRPGRRMLYVTWAQDDDPGMLRSVSITFTNLAWKGYRGARSARRSRADQRLEALVRSHLSQFDALNDPSYVGRAAELEISVACVDLFPPPAGPSSASGERLMAG